LRQNLLTPLHVDTGNDLIFPKPRYAR
jgi:hypothetical protein